MEMTSNLHEASLDMSNVMNFDRHLEYYRYEYCWFSQCRAAPICSINAQLKFEYYFLSPLVCRAILFSHKHQCLKAENYGTKDLISNHHFESYDTSNGATKRLRNTLCRSFTGQRQLLEGAWWQIKMQGRQTSWQPAAGEHDEASLAASHPPVAAIMKIWLADDGKIEYVYFLF